MAQSRSLYKEILRNFLDSIKPKYLKYTLVGKDYHGTEYYESSANSENKRTRRWFTPVIKNNYEQEIPTEWEAWLRHKRKDPPKEEEIQLNLAKMRQTIENARKLEKQAVVSRDEVKNPEKVPFPKYDFDSEPERNEGKKFP